jgi:hypothetical protein
MIQLATYVHVVEAATKAWALQPFSLFSSQESELLRWEVIPLDQWMITNFSTTHHKHGSLLDDT